MLRISPSPWLPINHESVLPIDHGIALGFGTASHGDVLLIQSRQLPISAPYYR
jgi:hypothetical protein